MEMNIITSLFAVLGSFFITAAAVPLIRRVALKYDIVDNPQTAARKVHQKITPLLGGTAIFISVFAMIFIFRFFGLADFSRVSDGLLIAVFVAAGLIMIGGIMDDKYNLKPVWQVIFPISAALFAVLAGIKIGYITNPIGGESNAIIYLNSSVGFIMAFVWLMGMMYTTKFLDGLDGLVSGISGIAALMIFFVSLSWDLPGSATGAWALIILGACLGFLLYNWQPAKIFLGEGGSIFLGFMLGVLSIISGSKITTTLLVIGIPALDVLWVIIQRVASGESPFSHADRKHLHYRLLELGFSRTGAVWFLYLIALTFGTFGIINSSFGKLVSLLLLIACMFFLIMATYLNQKFKNINESR